MCAQVIKDVGPWLKKVLKKKMKDIDVVGGRGDWGGRGEWVGGWVLVLELSMPQPSKSCSVMRQHSPPPPPVVASTRRSVLAGSDRVLPCCAPAACGPLCAPCRSTLVSGLSALPLGQMDELLRSIRERGSCNACCALLPRSAVSAGSSSAGRAVGVPLTRAALPPHSSPAAVPLCPADPSYLIRSVPATSNDRYAMAFDRPPPA